MTRTTVADQTAAPREADQGSAPESAPGSGGAAEQVADPANTTAHGDSDGDGTAGSDSARSGRSAASGGRAGESAAGGEASLEQMLGLVQGLVCPPSAVADLEELEACLERSRKARSWLDAYDAGLIAEAERRDVAAKTGAVNTAAWLRRRTGMSYYESRTRTRTSDGLDDVPAIRQALAEGRLSQGHAQALTRLTSPDGVDMSVDGNLDFPSWERTVAEAAREQLEALIVAAGEMTVDAYVRFLNRFADLAAGDDGAERDSRHLRNRRVTTSENHDGMGILRAVLPPAQFAVIENEMRRLAEAAWRAEHPDAEGISAKELSCPQRNADSLAEMARRSRALADEQREPLSNHIDVTVLVDAQTLDEGLHPDSRCELDDGRHITPTTARRLLCDANILTALWDKTKFKLDLGYDARCANRHIRLALIARDRTCTAPGCDRPHWMCQIHHNTPWSEGGPTNLDNLTLLCHKHHHQHHANQRKTSPSGPNRAKTATQNGTDPPGNAARAPSTGRSAPTDQNGTGRAARNSAGTPKNGTRAPSAGRPAPPDPNGAEPPGHGTGAPAAGRNAASAQNGSARPTPNGSSGSPRYGTAAPGTGRPAPPGPNGAAESSDIGTEVTRAGRRAPPEPEPAPATNR